MMYVHRCAVKMCETYSEHLKSDKLPIKENKKMYLEKKTFGCEDKKKNKSEQTVYHKVVFVVTCQV